MGNWAGEDSQRRRAQKARTDVNRIGPVPLYAFDFVIKANNQAAVRALLADAEIRRLIAAQPGIHIEVKDDRGWFGSRFPKGVDELCFAKVGMISDLDQLKGLFELFAALLHQLCHIGSACENDPALPAK